MTIVLIMVILRIIISIAIIVIASIIIIIESAPSAYHDCQYTMYYTCPTLLDTALLVLVLFTETGSKWLLLSTEDSAAPGKVFVLRNIRELSILFEAMDGGIIGFY